MSEIEDFSLDGGSDDGEIEESCAQKRGLLFVGFLITARIYLLWQLMSLRTQSAMKACQWACWT
eukprot:4205421-Amphidinium_carterae.2